MSRSSSRRRPRTRWPLTKVPLRDRSSSTTVQAPARRSSRACTLRHLDVPRQSTRSLSASRPMTDATPLELHHVEASVERSHRHERPAGALGGDHLRELRWAEVVAGEGHGDIIPIRTQRRKRGRLYPISLIRPLRRTLYVWNRVSSVVRVLPAQAEPAGARAAAALLDPEQLALRVGVREPRAGRGGRRERRRGRSPPASSTSDRRCAGPAPGER